MNFNEYQTKAIKTAIYPHANHNWAYPLIGLCGETGEIANKCKKLIRDDKGLITQDKRKEISDEIGDLLWYVAVLAKEFNLELEQIAYSNLAKIQSRQERNKIKGSGDTR